MNSPFHEGELSLQEENGVVERMDKVGRVVLRDHIIDQHKEFFECLPILFVGLQDASGRVWATLAEGNPGFIKVPNRQELKINGLPIAAEALNLQTAKGSGVGVLGLDFTNRRRNRLNGHLIDDTDKGLRIKVHHSFGNCPKYIQTRTLTPTENSGQPHEEAIDGLTREVVSLIEKADTFFVASAQSSDGDANLDMSHRGGRPGFVEVSGNTLTWLDYPGNNMFQTFGNIVVNPSTGLLFIDFENGDICLLQGEAHVQSFDSDAETGFVHRSVTFEMEKGLLVRNALKAQWEFDEASPFLPD